MTPWCAALAPVTLPVACGDQNHELHWAEGILAAPDHPDADRERALAALGAEPSPCLQILDAWTRHADDLDVLVLTSRGPADQHDSRLRYASHDPAPRYFGMHAPLSQSAMAYGSTASVRPAAMGWAAYRPMSRRRYVDVQDETPDDLPRLLSLGSGLPQRLSATVISTWAERIEAGDERVSAALPALDAAVYGRLGATLLPWLGRTAKIEFTLGSADATPAVRRDGDKLKLELPFVWLRDVWATGLAVVLDRFCIEAQQTAPGSWTLTTIDRDLASTHPITISG